MNDLIAPIGDRLRTNVEKSMLACVECKTVARRSGESDGEWEQRAWTFGDYYFAPSFVLRDFQTTILLVPCEEHMRIIVESEDVEANLAVVNYRRVIDLRGTQDAFQRLDS